MEPLRQSVHGSINLMAVVSTPTTTAIRSISVAKAAAVATITAGLMTLVALMATKATKATVLALAALHLIELAGVAAKALLRWRKTGLLVRGGARTSRLSERAGTRSAGRVLRVAEGLQSVLGGRTSAGLLGRGLLLAIRLVLGREAGLRPTENVLHAGSEGACAGTGGLVLRRLGRVGPTVFAQAAAEAGIAVVKR